MKVLIVIGTRPNFIKVTQFKKVAKEYGNLSIEILHTGQHYDNKMASVFFEQFGLTPDHYLKLEGNTASEQFANMVLRLSLSVAKIKPDYILVPGDVNSTLAGAIVANREGIRLGHLESGLRSFDRSMPEEVNRILVDQMADDYFVTEKSGMENLSKEGLDSKSKNTETFFVGNTMIDTLVAFKHEIENAPILHSMGLTDGAYILMTMHRPATVDNFEGLNFLLNLLRKITANERVILPMHPRTKSKLEAFNLKGEFEQLKNLNICEPLDYFSFQRLVKGAKAILTDSGGIQEESTFCGVPCITLRPNTERPITCEVGTNQLVGLNQDSILHALEVPKSGEIPELWDGLTTQRVIESLVKSV